MRFNAALFLLVFISLFYECMAQPSLWGVTKNGPNSGAGTIFSTLHEGNNFGVQHQFYKDGQEPQYTRLCEANNGKLYGVTAKGGQGAGTLFEYDPITDEHIVRHAFAGNGMGPASSLILADNGNIYGTTVSTGNYSEGTLFEYNVSTHEVTTLFHFNGAFYDPDALAGKPWGGVIQANNGKLYGTCTTSPSLHGALYEFDLTTLTLDVKIVFDLQLHGSNSTASMVEAPNGKLYGTCASGGSNGAGTLFEYDPATETFTKKVDFNFNDGYYSQTALIVGDDGLLYGVSWGGGASGSGVLFSYDINTEEYEVKHSFDESSGNPVGSLVQSLNGRMYGMTSDGGIHGRGMLYEYNPSDSTFLKKLDLDGETTGADPLGALLELEEGIFYGMTTKGGTANFGMLFKYDVNLDLHEKKKDFIKSAEGALPNGKLLYAQNKKIYGTTEEGGSENLGLLYEYDPIQEVYYKRADFLGIQNGAVPNGGLIQAANGKLYGTTIAGGTQNYGCIYEYDPLTETLLKKADFDLLNGFSPNGGMVEVEGKLYGTTLGGGSLGFFGRGVMYAYDIETKTIEVLVEFDESNKGAYPLGNLMLADNGKIYGTTRFGGQHNRGVLYEYDLTNDAYAAKVDFDGANLGSEPSGGLIQADDHKLYGLTNKGGIHDLGVLFEYNLADGICTKKIEFDGVYSGSFPEGGLIQASNGMLYGANSGGGSYNEGLLFEYNISTKVFKRLQDFSVDIGVHAISDLVEVNCLQSSPLLSIIESSELFICSGEQTEINVSHVGSENIHWYSAMEGGEFLARGLHFSTPPLNVTTSYYFQDSTCGYYDGRTEVTVVVNEPPTIDIIAINAVVCKGDSATLTGVGATNYQWSNNLENGVAFYPDSTKTYRLIGVDDNGCTDTLEQHIEVLQPEIHSQLIHLCPGESFTVGATSYEYSGEYTETFTAINGCDSIVETHVVMEDIDNSIAVDGQMIFANQPEAAYQWFDCDDNRVIEGATNNTYTATMSGNYGVILSRNGCVDTSACVSVTTTGVNEWSYRSNAISVRPNPSTGLFTLAASGVQLGDIRIYNMLGELVYFNQFNAPSALIDLTGVENGVYQVILTNNGFMESKRLVIDR